ncbi:unnamed protein product, partial [Mesorhabditis belari]|uniref:Uncharacterized protein n=1 Tax=Mesorhabditis belari TaxID=2138241 RepID=A0AAF3FNS8_9BILA
MGGGFIQNRSNGRVNPMLSRALGIASCASCHPKKPLYYIVNLVIPTSVITMVAVTENVLPSDFSDYHLHFLPQNCQMAQHSSSNNIGGTKGRDRCSDTRGTKGKPSLKRPMNNNYDTELGSINPKDGFHQRHPSKTTASYGWISRGVDTIEAALARSNWQRLARQAEPANGRFLENEDLSLT